MSDLTDMEIEPVTSRADSSFQPFRRLTGSAEGNNTLVFYSSLSIFQIRLRHNERGSSVLAPP